MKFRKDVVVVLASGVVAACGQGAPVESSESELNIPNAELFSVSPAETFLSEEEASEVALANQPEFVETTQAEAEAALLNARVSAVESQRSYKAGSEFNSHFPSGSSYTFHYLGSTNDYVCYPFGFAGRFKGSGVGGSSAENPAAWVADVDGSGNIYAFKPQSNGQMWVRCVPRTYFVDDANGFNAFQFSYSYSFIWDGQPYSCNQNVNWDTAIFNFASIIAGFGYDYNHSGDKFWITQSSTSGVKSKGNLFQSTSRCRGVGFVTPVVLHNTNVAANFLGPNGYGTAAAAGEWSYSRSSGTGFVNLNVPFNQAQCYFTSIGGNFSSDNDYALMQNLGGNWALFMGTTANSGVNAKVRCIPHNQ